MLNVLALLSPPLPVPTVKSALVAASALLRARVPAELAAPATTFAMKFESSDPLSAPTAPAALAWSEVTLADDAASLKRSSPPFTRAPPPQLTLLPPERVNVPAPFLVTDL